VTSFILIYIFIASTEVITDIMATTISASFLKFKQNLEITGLQSETVSNRQKNVREVLDDGLDVTDTFLSGSYARSTMISPLKEADVDIIAVLDSKYYHNYNNGQNNGQAGLLDLVKRTLKKTYTSTPDISRDGQAVTIRFTDFVVDVVPAFNRQGGGYIIANSIEKNWIETDPKKHVELISASNKAHNGDLVPLIKMIKSWNRNNNRHFNSFHLEVLALEILNNVTISDFPSGLRYFFDKGKDLINKRNPDPAGYGGDVGSYINTAEKIQTAVNKFQLAYERALKAEDGARQGQIQNAVNSWITILGDYFPAYG
jgi:hypothetical protein